MWLTKLPESRYLPVKSSESGGGPEYAEKNQIHQRHISWWHLLTLCVISTLFLLVGIVLRPLLQHTTITRNTITTQNSKCSNPTIRKEWRSLSQAEKAGYIAGVKCLTTKQSKLSLVDGDTLYNDFPYVHTTIGGYCESYQNCTMDSRH